MNLLVSDPTNIRYLTGFVSAEPQAREAFVLVTPKKTYLFTNSLYLEQAKTLGFPVIPISRDNPLPQALLSVIPGLTRNPSKQNTGSRLKGRDDKFQLAFEEANITVSEYNALKKKFTLVPTRNKIEMQRMIKKENEIASIRLAAKLTDECFSYIKKFIKPGVTEAHLAWKIESYIRTRGGALAFSPIVAFNSHSSQPHYQGSRLSLKEPRGLALKNQSLVLLDFGARVDGYCGDMTRVVFVGKPKPEWERAYKTVSEAQTRAIEALSKGERRGAKLDEIARGQIKDFPPYSHSLGHGVGLDIHEAPRLTVKKDELLKPGMVVSVEPGVYIEGKFGIRIEDLVLLTKSGPEILSKSPKDLTK